MTKFIVTTAVVVGPQRVVRAGSSARKRAATGRFRLFAGLLVAATLAACSTTTAPSPAPPTIGSPPGGPATGITLSVSSLERATGIAAWLNFVERPVTFSWAAVPGASEYLVEMGTSPGSANVFSASTTALSLTTTFTATGQFYPRVTAFSGRIGGRTSDARFPLILFSAQDYVEALFLGTGPLARTPQTGCLAGAGRMTGWPAGSSVTMTLASSLNADQKRRANAAVVQSRVATAGVVGGTTRDSTDAHPVPGQMEIVAEQADLVVPFPCSSEALGCAVPLQFLSPGILARASIVIRGGSTSIGHEIGHALYGFCHLTIEAGYASVMGNFDDDGRGLSEADIAATQAVYQAGLRAGATRGDFLAAGLIKP